MQFSNTYFAQTLICDELQKILEQETFCRKDRNFKKICQKMIENYFYKF